MVLLERIRLSKDEVPYWVGFNLVPRIGPVRVNTLLKHFGSLKTAWNADSASLRAAGLPQDALEKLALPTQPAWTWMLRWTRLRLRAWTCSPGSILPTPALLKSIAQPPPVLYVRGEIAPADQFAVAIVGTRHASVYGKEVARRMATDWRRTGSPSSAAWPWGSTASPTRQPWMPVGARWLCSDAGLTSSIPSEHRELAQRMTTSGALISDYPLGTSPEAVNFPPRNRIISGLSLGTLIVEASLQSGALITHRFCPGAGTRDLCGSW